MAKKLIELVNVTKKFDGETVVDNLNLYINQNEFITLLGPSGCGKTTTLRMIGGFETPDSGDIILEGVKINDYPPFRRPINTVFQRYALFPHLNVFENVAYGLRNYHVQEPELTQRVMEALKMVNLEGFEKRKVDSLSGGQQQRVAIARATVIRPRILLLDEPLAALDLKLRQAMQYELKEMQRRLGITFIYVTHDQEEALTMSDTVVVMNKGLIQQIGHPRDIYNEPKNRFVCNFIGQSNIFDGVVMEDHKVRFCNQVFSYEEEGFSPGEEVDVVVRPEDFDVCPKEKAQLIAPVLKVIFKGIHFEITVDILGRQVLVHEYEEVKVGDMVGIKVDPYEIHLMKKAHE